MFGLFEVVGIQTPITCTVVSSILAIFQTIGEDGCLLQAENTFHCTYFHHYISLHYFHQFIDFLLHEKMWSNFWVTTLLKSSKTCFKFGRVNMPFSAILCGFFCSLLAAGCKVSWHKCGEIAFSSLSYNLAGTYSKPSQTSKIELFAKIVNE